jgi:hypothetical protein
MYDMYKGGRDHDRMVVHWGKADDRNCNCGHPKMVNVESGKNLSIKLFL